MPIGNDLLMNVLYFSWLYVCIAWGSLWAPEEVWGVYINTKHLNLEIKKIKNNSFFVWN